jgi:hypothetical protein
MDPHNDPQPAAEARIIQWIAGGLAALLLMLGGAWLTNIGAQVESLRVDQKSDMRESSEIRERLRGVEAQLEGVAKTTEATAMDVRRIRESIESLRTRSGSWTEEERTTSPPPNGNRR